MLTSCTHTHTHFIFSEPPVITLSGYDIMTVPVERLLFAFITSHYARLRLKRNHVKPYGSVPSFPYSRTEMQPSGPVYTQLGSSVIKAARGARGAKGLCQECASRLISHEQDSIRFPLISNRFQVAGQIHFPLDKGHRGNHYSCMWNQRIVRVRF